VKFQFIVLILFLVLVQLTQCKGRHDNSGQKGEDLFENNDALVGNRGRVLHLVL